MVKFRTTYMQAINLPRVFFGKQQKKSTLSLLRNLRSLLQFSLMYKNSQLVKFNSPPPPPKKQKIKILKEEFKIPTFIVGFFLFII